MVKEERGRPRGQVLCSSAWEALVLLPWDLQGWPQGSTLL